MNEQEIQDLKLGALFQIIGHIIIKWNSINYSMAKYLAKEANDPPTFPQIHDIFNNQSSYQISGAFLAALQRNSQVFMPDSELENSLKRMREIRNSTGHWIGGINEDRSFGLFDSKNHAVVDINSLYQEFQGHYFSVNNGLVQLIS